MASTQDNIELRRRRNTTSASYTFPLSQQRSPTLGLTTSVDEGSASHQSVIVTSREIEEDALSTDEDSQVQDDRSPILNSEGSMANSPLARSSTAAGVKVPKHITRATKKRFFKGWLAHMPALLTTLIVLVVGSKKIYWYPEQGPLLANKYRVDAETIGNVLQLAAKVHELLIIASLSSISLAMFRRRLITKGVRLGFLTGSYRVGDLNYLGTAAFWRQDLNLLEPWEILLSGFLVFATIMSTIVGPASAVLLLPTLDWFEFQPDTAFENIQTPLIYWWNRDDVWRRNHSGSGRLENCTSVEGIYLAHCPAGGFMQILTWVQNYGATDLGNNLTFPATSANIRRQVIFTQGDLSQDTASATLCTTAPQFLLDSIGLFQQYINDANEEPVGAVSGEPRYRLSTKSASDTNSSSTGLYQPFVQSRCTVHNIDDAPEEISYPVKDLRCFKDQDCPNYSGVWEVPSLNGSYIDMLKKKYDDEHSAISRFFTKRDNSPVLHLNGLIPHMDTQSNESSKVLYLCSMTANWVRTSFSTDQGASDILHSEFNNKNSMHELYINNTSRETLPIRFSQSWLDYLNPKWNTTKLTGVNPLWVLAQGFFQEVNENGTTSRHMVTGNNETAMEIFLSKAFGGYLTEALARTSFGADTRIKLNKTDFELNFVNLDEQYGFRGGTHKIVPKKAPENGTWDEWRNKTHIHRRTPSSKSFEEYNNIFETALPIHMVAERYGYGTGQKRKTLLFAQAMLCISLGAVTTYIAAIIIGHVLEVFEVEIRGRPVCVLSIIPWSDLQELFILGLKSPPPTGDELVDAGAGVTSTKVWEKVVRAGADDEQNVRLGFEETQVERLDHTGVRRYY